MKPEGNTKQRLLQTAIDLIWQNSYGSTSVDDICARAGVNKGSFYYAFKTKSELAIAAFEAHWDARRPAMDAIFSAQNDPLSRLAQYCEAVVRNQLERYEELGKVLGCPFCSIGCELSTQDEAIRRSAQEMSDRVIRYLAGAVRDAAAQRILPAETDSDQLARQLFYLVTGVLMLAKIENNPETLKGLKPGMFRLLGLEQPAARAATTPAGAGSAAAATTTTTPGS
ncbi:MAG: TetR/AcrR family transcriptional regulator [Verrucomicrobia bacterium]|nr:TetR/AcrR family transcriptional regulator [Verrucomicrobiota bacterium]